MKHDFSYRLLQRAMLSILACLAPLAALHAQIACLKYSGVAQCRAPMRDGPFWKAVAGSSGTSTPLCMGGWSDPNPGRSRCSTESEAQNLAVADFVTNVTIPGITEVCGTPYFGGQTQQPTLGYNLGVLENETHYFANNFFFSARAPLTSPCSAGRIDGTTAVNSRLLPCRNNGGAT
jgi:hypothetical protein